MKNLIISSLFIITFLSTKIVYGQFPLNTLFLNKTSINKYTINEIKEFYKSDTDSPTDSNYIVYQFKNGLYTSGLTASGETQGDISIDYSINGQVTEVDSRDDISAHQSYKENYKYLNGRITLSIIGIAYWSQDTSGSFINGLKKWFYYPDKRVKYSIDYGECEIDSKEVSNNKLDHFMRSPESEKYPALLSALKIDETLRTYFIYYKSNIVGIYKRGESDMGGMDTVSFAKKIKDLKKLGFTDFSFNNYSERLYQKVIEDTYTEIKNKDLLINDKPVKQFLSEIGKPDTKYIILKLRDDSFLFYKILD